MAPSPDSADPSATIARPTPILAASPHPLRTRILSALALGPVALGLVWWGGAPFALFLALAGLLMAHEWARLTARPQAGWSRAVLAATTVAAVAATGLGMAVGPTAIGLAVAALVLYGLARSAGVQAPLWLAAGAVVIGLPCVAFVWLRLAPEHGRAAVLWLLAVVWATDIGAYAAGRTIGGPRLAPRISPNKTWAGLLGGMLAASVVGGGAALLLGGGATLAAATGPALAGGALAVVAQGGDLGESLAKRRFGVKDTGAVIPGHGGVLDRVDGLMPTALVMAVLVWLNGGSVFGW